MLALVDAQKHRVESAPDQNPCGDIGPPDRIHADRDRTRRNIFKEIAPP